MASYGNRDDNVYVNWVKASAGSVSPEKTVPLEQHFDVVMYCDWSCDREVLLAFGGRDGLVSLWKVENKALQASRLRLLLTATATPQITLEHLFTGFKAGIECVSIDASNRLLFTADTTASFYIHSVETGECLFVVALKPILTPILRGSFKHLHVIAMACSVPGRLFRADPLQEGLEGRPRLPPLPLQRSARLQLCRRGRGASSPPAGVPRR